MATTLSGALHISGLTFEQKLELTHILYDDLVNEDNITATSSAADFPVVGLANPLTFERWKPTVLPATVTVDIRDSLSRPVDIDSIGIASHTLAQNSCAITVSASTDGLIWFDVHSSVPANGRPIMAIFEQRQAAFVRINITGVSTPSIGVFYVGKSLVMQRKIYGGHSPITMARKTKRIMNRTEGGQYAGISIVREGVSNSFSWENLTPEWYRDEFDPFAVAARSTPFFISWLPCLYPSEVGYCWTGGDITPSNSGINNFINVSMNVEGYSDE